MENEVKEAMPKYNYISPDEYLEITRASAEKHEYYEGSSTQKDDLGYKLLYYQHIPSLQEYIMIDSAKRFDQTVRKKRMEHGELKIIPFLMKKYLFKP